MIGTEAMSIAGAVLFLLLGLVEFAMFRRFVYPGLRWRFEEAKAYGRRTADPALVVNVMKVVSLVVMPVIGFVLGGQMAPVFGGAS